MSLIDPSTRWWNRYSVRRVGATVCWVIAISLAFILGFTLFGLGDITVPVWFMIVGSALPVPLLVAAAFLNTFGSEDNTVDPRRIFIPIEAYFVALGLGWTIGQLRFDGTLPVTGLLFAVLGIIAIVLTIVISARIQRRDALRARVDRGGTVARAVVTRAHSYQRNYRNITKVTVQFTDAQGAQRWFSDTVSGVVNVGASVTVRYSQADLGRSGAVVITRY